MFGRCVVGPDVAEVSVSLPHIEAISDNPYLWKTKTCVFDEVVEVGLLFLADQQ